MSRHRPWLKDAGYPLLPYIGLKKRTTFPRKP
jgi:hypothetical protein